MKWWRHGNPLHDEPKRKRAGKRYDWPKNTNITKLDTPCREWMGSRNDKGYGTLMKARKHVRVHRYVWEMAYGPIPDGMVIMHRCDNRACFRLDHLQLGTMADNSQDMAKKGRAGRGGTTTTPELVMEIRTRFAAGERTVDLAAKYGLAVPTLYDMLSGRTWSDVPHPGRAA
jgi:hypothetical protein